MWKRNDSDDELDNSSANPAKTESGPTSKSRGSAANKQNPAAAAVIGPSIKINGDVTGDEDIFVRGSVEGSIKLSKHNVRIGKEGSVNASVNARVITVEGDVRGDLTGIEQIIVMASGNVQGNISAPGWCWRMVADSRVPLRWMWMGVARKQVIT